MKYLLVGALLIMSLSIGTTQNIYQPEWSNQDYQGVIKKAQSALMVNSSDSIAYYYLGLSYTGLKEHNKAIESLLTAKSKGLNFVNVDYNLALNYAQLNQKELALQELEAAASTGSLLFAKLEVKELDVIKSDSRFVKIKKQVHDSTFPCKVDKNFRKFDFWVGEWEVYAGGGKGPKIAESTISLSNGDCAVLENYRPLGGLPGGNSISYYDSQDKKWKQEWVAGNGSVSHYIEPENPSKGDLQIIAESFNAQSGKSLLMMSYFDNKEEGSVKQLMEISNDQGTTWRTVFNGLYRKKKQ